jgi:hypothetical protein
MLYTNGEEYLTYACNPVLLNGINSVLHRGDLADRAIAVTLLPIPDERRRPESEVWTEFEAAAPGVLAALLDGLVVALRRLPEVKRRSGGTRRTGRKMRRGFRRSFGASRPPFASLGWK